MSREVAAACEGALEAGWKEILVKDAHDSARNIDPNLLPSACASSGLGRGPAVHDGGAGRSFDGVVFTGYHSNVGSDANPLAHTMNTRVYEFLINGEPASELYINCLIAAHLGVPVYCVTGDQALCNWMKSQNPVTLTCPWWTASAAAPFRPIPPPRSK